MSTGARFITAFVIGMAGLIVSLGTLFVGLDQADRLKAPAFANRLSFDEKLRLLRDEPLADVEILLVGSSTTLHGVDGDLLRQVLHFRGGVANLGVQDLRINQARFLTDQFLSVYPHAAQLVMVSTLGDFKDCQNTPARFFNPDQVKKYLSKSLPAIFFQFKYLDLEGVVKRAADIKDLRRTTDELDSVSFDRSGSLLLNVPRDRINPRVWRGDPITLDPACYQSLRALALDLRRARLAFTYVIAPMRPGYLADRDPDGALLAEHRRRLQEQLAGTGALLIDAHAALKMPEEAFFDAYHLNRPWAEALTRYIGEQMTVRSAELQGHRPAGAAGNPTQTVVGATDQPPEGTPADGG
jgi:hypothetical protein